MKHFYANGIGMAFAEGSSHPPTIDTSCCQVDKERDREIPKRKGLNARSILSSPFLAIPRNLAAIGYAIVRYGFDRCSTAIRRVVEAGLELRERRVEPLSNQSRRSLEPVSKSSRRRVEEEWKKGYENIADEKGAQTKVELALRQPKTRVELGMNYQRTKDELASSAGCNEVLLHINNREDISLAHTFPSFSMTRTLLYSLTNKEANKSRLGQHLAKSISKSLNISEPFHFVSFIRSVFNRISYRLLTLCRPRSIDLDRAIETMNKKDSNYLSIYKNVASKFLTYHQRLSLQGSVESKIYSDEFLRTFREKKYEPCHGFSDGKHSVLGKERRGKVLFKSRYTNSQISKFALLLIFICCLFSYAALAQSHKDSVAVATGLGEVKPLQIGYRVSEDFWTKEHLFYINGDTVRKTLEEHKGKMLILDFWSSGCAPCLLHQKEINYFKERYADRLAIVMVNSKKTRENYEKIKSFAGTDRFKQLGIKDFSSIVEDEYLEELFPYVSFPTYIWINRLGIFQLQTFRNLLDKHYQVPYLDRLP